MFAQQAAARQQFEELRRRGLWRPRGQMPRARRARPLTGRPAGPPAHRRQYLATPTARADRFRGPALLRGGGPSRPPVSLCAKYTGTIKENKIEHHRHDVHDGAADAAHGCC